MMMLIRRIFGYGKEKYAQNKFLVRLDVVMDGQVVGSANVFVNAGGRGEARSLACKEVIEGLQVVPRSVKVLG